MSAYILLFGVSYFLSTVERVSTDDFVRVYSRCSPVSALLSHAKAAV